MSAQRCIAALLFAGLLTTSNALIAADGVYYVGGSWGEARVNFDHSPPIAAGFPVTYSNSDKAWNAFAGYQYNKYFSAEISYAELGDYLANLAVPGVGNLFTNIQINGWTFSLLGTVPLRDGFSVYGRVGESYMRETRGNCTICVSTVSTASDNTWSPTFGIGLRYDINSSLMARGEITHYTKVGNNYSSGGTFDATINLYTIGLAYKFD